MSDGHTSGREYDFSLVLSGPAELTDEQAGALFAAGCDDATPSVSYGRVWLEFSRTAPSYRAAVLSAIRDVRRAGIGADVERVDECSLVTQAEIARKIGKTPQYVQQLMTGRRGPGGFPPPDCHLSESTLLWQWCAVSHWLVANNVVRPEAVEEFDAALAINEALKTSPPCGADPATVDDIRRALAGPVPDAAGA